MLGVNRRALVTPDINIERRVMAAIGVEAPRRMTPRRPAGAFRQVRYRLYLGLDGALRWHTIPLIGCLALGESLDFGGMMGFQVNDF